MKRVQSFLKHLNPTDAVIIVFALFLSHLNIIYHDKIGDWLNFVIYNTVVILLITGIVFMTQISNGELWKQLHYWYIAPLIVLAYKELYFMIKPIRGVDYDAALIAIDRFLFGTDPTHFLYSIANPFLTELLQIVYGTFFFLPIILGINLLLKHKESDFHFAVFSIIFGFLLSYIGYILVPAIGPRFTLHNFELNDIEIPGLFLTNYLREFVNAGESIPSGTLNPAEVVQRDVFPSGHTQMTLIVMYLSVKFRTGTRYFFLPVGTLLIFSTVYLRYHYVVDLIGGLFFMVLTLWAGKKLYNHWQKFRGGETFEYTS